MKPESAFTYKQWEALWLLTMGFVRVYTKFSKPHGGPNYCARSNDGIDITSRFERLKDQNFVTIHAPGWLNGVESGWRIEITNAGWRAMDTRPSRGAVHENEET